MEIRPRRRCRERGGGPQADFARELSESGEVGGGSRLAARVSVRLGQRNLPRILRLRGERPRGTGGLGGAQAFGRRQAGDAAPGATMPPSKSESHGRLLMRRRFF